MELTIVNMMYSGLLLQISSRGSKRKTDFKKWVLLFKRVVRELKHTKVSLFEDHCDRELFTIKFHFFDHLCDDLENYRSIQFIDATP